MCCPMRKRVIQTRKHYIQQEKRVIQWENLLYNAKMCYPTWESQGLTGCNP